MPVILTIEFDLTLEKVILRTPLSTAVFSDTESDRIRLFRALRANAKYRAHVYRSLKEVRKFSERGREKSVYEQLEIDLDSLGV